MADSTFKIPLKASLNKLKNSGHEFIEFFSHGSLSVEIYKPHKIDNQTPHTRNEIYVIANGTGEFLLAKKRTTFSPGDVLFVPAGEEHKFENFSDDFITWVFFYGPEGGEQNV